MSDAIWMGIDFTGLTDEQLKQATFCGLMCLVARGLAYASRGDGVFAVSGVAAGKGGEIIIIANGAVETRGFMELLAGKPEKGT